MNKLVRTMFQIKLQKFAITLLILCGIFLSTTRAFGQVLPHANIVTLKSLQRDGRLDSANVNRLNSLLHEIQTAIYLDASGVKVYGANPVCLYTDLAHFKAITSLADVDHIELVTVRIYPDSDLGNEIDINLLSDFPKLKYVYILSTADLPEVSLKKIIKNYNDSGIIVFYSIVKDS